MNVRRRDQVFIWADFNDCRHNLYISVIRENDEVFVIWMDVQCTRGSIKL